MLLSNKKKMVLGIGVFLMVNLAEALPANEGNIDFPPAPVMEEGARVYAGDEQKNEFFILGKNEPVPVKAKPVYVNAQPLQASIDSRSILKVSPTQVVDATKILSDQYDKAHANQRVNQVKTNNPSHHFEIVETPANEGAPNYSRIKAALHKMTRKMADKKKHSKVKIARKTKRTIKQEWAMNVKHPQGKVKQTELQVLKIRFIS